MKILHLIQTSNHGGAETLFYTLVKNIGDNYRSYGGFIKDGLLLQKLQKIDVRTTIFPTNRYFDVKLIVSLKRFIQKNKIDLVHSHLLDMNFYSSLAAKMAGVPHIATEHGDVHLPSNRIDRKMIIKMKSLVNFTDKIVFVSRFTERKYRELISFSPLKSTVIYNGIPLKKDQTKVDVSKIRRDLGISDNEIVIGNVANLYPVKGQTYLLKAILQISKKHNNLKLLLVGRGKLESQLKREAKSLGIVENVEFLGFRADVNKILKVFDIFVLPSLSEGLPVSLLEAIANQVPVIASKVGGIPEVIENSVDGFLVPPKDYNLLADRIEFLIQNRDVAKIFAEKAYQKFLKEFQLSLMIDKYLELYSKVIKNY